MSQLDDITLVLCIDENHLNELEFAWQTWKKYKPELINLKNKLIIYDSKIKDKLSDLSFIDEHTLLHEFSNHQYYKSQRDSMLTSWFEGFR